MTLRLATPIDSSDELLMGDDERTAFLAPIHMPRLMIRADVKVGNSGYRGVSKQRTGPNYFASLRARRARHYLGTFPTAIAAARAYDAKARELHGDLAILNFPDETTEEAA